MTFRQISGLRWAEWREEGPWPKARARGAKAAGLRYERAFGKALGLRRSRWIEFEDRNGHGWAQPDFVSIGEWLEPIVFECKYTWTLEGHEQLEKLYAPLVELLEGQAPGLIQVCKVLTPETSRYAMIREDYPAALAVFPARSVWHWIPGTVAKSHSPRPRRVAPAPGLPFGASLR